MNHTCIRCGEKRLRGQGAITNKLDIHDEVTNTYFECFKCISAGADKELADYLEHCKKVYSDSIPDYGRTE